MGVVFALHVDPIVGPLARNTGAFCSTDSVIDATAKMYVSAG